MTRILVLDLETAPTAGWVWSLWNQNLGLSQIIDHGRIMAFAAKWVGEKGVEFYSEWDDVVGSTNDEHMVQQAWRLLDEADLVVTYNGNKFDLPLLNRAFIKAGLGEPSPYASVDLLVTVKKRFRFTSNKLDNVCQELGIGSKTKHNGFELWLGCMAGDPASRRLMERYNKRDVVLTERLYKRLLPWISNHPNVALIDDKDGLCCPGCGSTKVQKRGMQTLVTGKYQRYQCGSCGKWFRDVSRETGVGVRGVS